jgi:phage terminase small subunit
MPRGGARPGAGRPRGSKEIGGKIYAAERVLRAHREETAKSDEFKSALGFAMAVINDPTEPMEARIRLAIAVLPFQHPKLESVSVSKKAEREKAGRELAETSEFSTPTAPKLIVDNG